MLGGFKLFWISGQCTPVGISSVCHAINRRSLVLFFGAITSRFARAQHAVVLCPAASLHRYVHCTCTCGRGQPGNWVPGNHMGPRAACALCGNWLERQWAATAICSPGAMRENTRAKLGSLAPHHRPARGRFSRKWSAWSPPRATPTVASLTILFRHCELSFCPHSPVNHPQRPRYVPK